MRQEIRRESREREKALYNLRKRYSEFLGRPANFPNREFFLTMLRDQALEYGEDLTKTVKPSAKPQKPIRRKTILFEASPGEYLCKVYSDGSQMICTREGDNPATNTERHPVSVWDRIYSDVRNDPAVRELPHEQKLPEICKRISDMYDYSGHEPLSLFVDRKLNNENAAGVMREKRFYRKRDQVKWQYFTTFTYSDTKCSEDKFRSKLLRLLNNHHSRYGLLYILCWERGSKTGRLHAHCVMYYPGDFPGKDEIHEVWRFSEKEGRYTMQHENPYFAQRFGNNDFDKISCQNELCGSFMYVFKYAYKDGAKPVYSRGIPSYVLMRLTAKDLNVGYIVSFKRRARKFVLFPGTVIKKDVGFAPANIPPLPLAGPFEAIEFQ